MIADHRLEALKRYISERSIENRNAVVAAHRYLCRRGARKFFRGTVERTDLEQVAAIGLIKACSRYDGSYETPFEAYAWLMIVGELMHFVRDHERLVRVPRQVRTLERRFRAAYDKLSCSLQREPSQKEIAVELGVAISDLDELRMLRTQRLAEDDGGDFTRVTREHEGRISAMIHKEDDVEDRLALAAALRQLSERERRIVGGIFFHQCTQAEVGKQLGISQRQVSRVLARTLQRLAKLIAA